MKEKLETDGTEAGLKQQLELEREKSTNRELKRELLVYEGVLPPYLDTQGIDWINSRRRKWTKENKELKEERDAAVQVSHEYPIPVWECLLIHGCNSLLQWS